MERFTGIEFEYYVAKFYANKVSHCKQDGKEFALTLPDVRRLLNVKCCQYTGMKLTHQFVGSSITRYTDLTLDRIDNSKGYVKGNVKAVAKGINMLKATFENETHANSRLDFKTLGKFGKVVSGLLKGTK